jgi:hypothetical protein
MGAVCQPAALGDRLAVTRHDAPASVRAGFAGLELSALWPNEGRWELHESTRLFAHCFVARKRGPQA